ncbi:acyl-CoA N-acyltransferase [Myriangium duriaei CBS 260.36]|uniref:Acyl-CoA N-acyltransferase n=1 Tax=Myriangium duriaei CBS 260.36 TaxID=1168546 RepID=A0A9P4J2F8_9PEZI|nr:acyl-CoA N-acyltransferase [Myriangium duriaei CBS 260.36]
MMKLLAEYWPCKESSLASRLGVRPLTPADVLDCVNVESVFPSQERCSEAKFHYRLKECPYLCLGLFDGTTSAPISEKLIGHVIATRTSEPSVTEGAMEIPDQMSRDAKTDTTVGHDQNGKNVAVHSLCIIQEYQGRKLGRALISAYINYLEKCVADTQNVVIIAHDHLIKFYESVEFVNNGPSKCTFGGGGWFDMALDLRKS